MKYRNLGNSNLEISEIGFGCMSLEQDQETASSLLRNAHEKGINFFDTADLYDKGMNEEMVGKALKPIRKEILISTKVGNVWEEGKKGWKWAPSKDYILSAIDDSLQRLQTDYIDLYMLHGGTIDDPIDEIIEAFEQLKEKGKIRAYGISSIRPNTIREYVEKSNIEAVMMQYSLLDRRPEESCLGLLNDAGISVLTRGSLAKGLLIDKEPKEYLDRTEKEVQETQQAATATGNPIGASLQYVWQHPAVDSSVVGIRTQKQLNEVVMSARHEVSISELSKLRNLLEANVYDKHR